MIKKILNNLKLPFDIINNIYSYADPFYEIKNKNKVWYQRLITKEYVYYPKEHKKLYLKREEKMLRILLDQNAYTIISNIHNHNLNI
jgi:hypothetical protein